MNLKKIKLPISLVICSIGEKILFEVLKQLQIGDYYIDEILIIIPKECSLPAHLDTHNYKYIFTNFKSQVKQRIHGFKMARNNIVMQLDTDCIISCDDILNLYDNLIKLGRNNVVGPVYIDIDTNQCIHKFEKNFINKFKRIITYFICGAKFGLKRMGTISKVGSNYGVDPNYIKSDIFSVEWLPGGCAIYFKEDLILENYFPFKGKAYCEDLIHAYWLKQNKVKLWITKKSVCASETPKFPDSLIEIKKYLNAYKYFMQIQSNVPHFSFRYKLWFFLTWLRRVKFKL